MTSAALRNDRATLFQLLETMWLVRAFEEKVSELYARGEITGLVHLAIGQEATAVGVCGLLETSDSVFGNHRSHAHAIAKGADVKRLMAELVGRETGYCRGLGGSMHIVAIDAGFVTATGIVGGTIPLALGAALAARERGRGQVAVVFFGDGAGQTGAFHESLNLARLWRLPVVFVCENNGYAEFTPLAAHTVVSRLARHAETYGIPSSTVDGNNLFAVRKAAAAAVERARAGKGPSFVECLTYRLRGHYEGDPDRYRLLAEKSEWKAKDPIGRVIRNLKRRRIASGKDIDASESRARAKIEEAVEFALSSPRPRTDSNAAAVSS